MSVILVMFTLACLNVGNCWPFVFVLTITQMCLHEDKLILS